METFDFTGYNNRTLPTYVWLPEGEATAVLQITHGMTEHMGHYEAFAQYLCSRGVAVAGFDLRGYGRNPGNPEIVSFGEGGWMVSIEDIRFSMICCINGFPEQNTTCLASPWDHFCFRNT